jgi:hypothetical protein
MKRKSLGLFFYVLSLLTNAGGTLFIVVIHWNLLLTGKGIGSFSAIFIIEYLLVGFMSWGIGAWLNRQRKLDLTICIASCIPIILLIVFPVKFYIE